MAKYIDPRNQETGAEERDRKEAAPGERLNDIHDSARDEERLQPDEATIELPDVADIPGQEHVHVPPLGELADTTISSDDEEGSGLFDDNDTAEDDQARNRQDEEK